MKLKHSLSLLALASCAALSTSALAQSSGTLNIAGNISSVSCTPSLTGGAINGNTLTLPDAYIGDLDAANKTTQDTAFSFAMNGCSAFGTINNVWVHFSGNNIDSNGLLTLTTSPSQSTSAKLRFEITDGLGGTAIVAGGSAVAQPGVGQGTAVQFSGANPSKSATKTYAVRYRSLAALDLNDVGAVASSVTYNVKYY